MVWLPIMDTHGVKYSTGKYTKHSSMYTVKSVRDGVFMAYKKQGVKMLFNPLEKKLQSLNDSAKSRGWSKTVFHGWVAKKDVKAKNILPLRIDTFIQSQTDTEAVLKQFQ